MLAYHTSHIVSDTGRMTLEEGPNGDFEVSIVGLLHNRRDRFEVEPLIMGAPTLEHPRNEGDGLAWSSRDHGEILAKDIDQFSALTTVVVASADEWMSVMRNVSEEQVKRAFAGLLAEPTKNDWGGELNDHFSASLSIGGRRRTAAFLLKGPTSFREMTLDMCGKQADQIYRLAGSGGGGLHRAAFPPHRRGGAGNPEGHDGSSGPHTLLLRDRWSDHLPDPESVQPPAGTSAAEALTSNMALTAGARPGPCVHPMILDSECRWESKAHAFPGEGFSQVRRGRRTEANRVG
ncbi:hypothetical protein [Brevundimonas diminuta]